MTKFKKNDFVKIEFDIVANGKLVQTTNEKTGKENKLNLKEYGPQTIILGKQFIIKALDDEILKGNEENTLELTPKEAYGNRDKSLIKVFPKSAFDKHKTRAIVGMTYDFNGMFGTVKSVAGGRIMVDFNNPLAGKDIKLTYKVLSKIENIVTKIEFVLGNVLKVPKNTFKIELENNILTLNVQKELRANEKMLIKGIEEFVGSLKEFTCKIETFKKQ